ncbi:hypothetical protein [Bradyrhizobium sp. AZCC 2289]|uniref:hypothetical protein n=1 Tax=Bradyrhizobium sp. AZCC 2289 TaxID=3117026 RepID=UPI002FF244FD
MLQRVNYSLVGAILFGLAPIEAIAADSFSYPETKREMVAETYHGVVVSDPYRWLECPCSQEVTDWLDRRNAITDAYLDKTPQWRAIADRLTVLTKVRSNLTASQKKTLRLPNATGTA